MFNNLDNDGWVKGSEVVLYKGQMWVIVAEGKAGIVLENDYSYDPKYREYSAASMMYSNV